MRYPGIWTSVLAIAVVFFFAATPAARAVEKTWNQSGGGSGAVPDYWTPYGVPGEFDTAILPNIGGFYTVTSDAAWHIDDLEVGKWATARINGYNLEVNNGGDIYGTLRVEDATYTAGSSVALKTGSSGNGTLQMANAVIAGSVNTSSSSQILGYGTINDDLSTNNGLIRAENGQLNIGLNGYDHDYGTLSAATNAILHIRDTHDVTNRATIDLQGGTLWGYQYSTYNLINDDEDSLISGRGTIDRYYVQNNVDAVITPSGGTLTLNKGFASNQNNGTINLASGATLSVGNASWTNYGYINMTGGTIIGQTLVQAISYRLIVTAGSTSSVQNVSFTAPFGASISNGATLNITGTGDMVGTTIYAGSGSGTFSVASGATVQGRGTVQTNLDVAGTFNANSSGNSIIVEGATTVLPTGQAKAEGGGTLSLNGSVLNRGNVKANGGTVAVTGTIQAATDATGDFSATSAAMNLSAATFQSAVRNTFTAYSNGTITLPGGLSTANLYVNDALRPRSGTINVPNGTTLTNGDGKTIAGYGILLEGGRSLANCGTVDASGGTLELRGTVLADVANDGDFSATLGTLRVAATLQTGLYNTFTANGNGVVTFPGDLNTSLFQGDGLLPRGGTITLEASGATLTNAAGKTVAGNGQLLESGRNLVNQGTVRGENGTLSVQGAITNGNVMEAVAGGMLTLAGTLTNNGQIATSGSGVVTVSDPAPSGGGTFTANTNGSIHLRNGFTNANLTAADALRLAGGSLTLVESAGAMTNAAGKILRGYGTLLEPNQSLQNNGLLEADGSLVVNGTVTNPGNTVRADSAGDAINFTGQLSNQGSVEIGAGASLAGGTINVTDSGQISLDEAMMTVRSSLTFIGEGRIQDNGVLSEILVQGNLDNRSGAAEEFHIEHSSLTVYGLGIVGINHKMTWMAEDLGAELNGLDDNLAVGLLTFGDGLGMPDSDPVDFVGDTTIYCYGLHVQQDAHLDLGGRTIYYLRDGVEHNGIVGTGCLLEGTYENGEIIEIVPEPSTWMMLLLLLAVTAYRSALPIVGCVKRTA
ncbi:MAG: hypothetical protein JXB10_14205 [Pirellulales bacterium]|nr:hypothetical protein [Pirellulales bacterium]